MSYYHEPDGQLTLLELDRPEDAATQPRRKAPAKSVSELVAIPYLYLDLSPGHVDLFGNHYWELRSPYREGKPPLNTGPAPREPLQSSLSEILESEPAVGYYLSQTACRGILRRAEERGKELPPQLKAALMAQAGLNRWMNQEQVPVMIGQADGDRPEMGFPVAFAANQRDEVRDPHDVAGVFSAQPGMKQQTCVAGITAKGNGDCFLSEEQHTALSCGGGMAGQGYPCALVAGFSAGAGASAGSIGYSETVAPTLKGTASGNCMPSVLCLNDQGGSVMDCSEDVAGALRAQEHGHQPLVFDNHGQDTRFCGPVGKAQTVSASFGAGGNNQPLVYENHGIDARYTGPHPVAPTLSARAGTGGNNLPLVEQETPEAICIMGPAIDRQPHNGGNGIGYQKDIAYTLTATDHHAVFSRQRVDKFAPGDVASTESARQHKDATDLIYQEAASTTAGGAGENPNSRSVEQNPPVTETPLLIRRLTPLECERLQGFPDGWTDIPGASGSARYRALGNSVAIPCVEFIMRGIVAVLCYNR